MKSIRLATVIILAVLVLSQCQTGDKSVDTDELESLKLSYQAINDSIAVSWKLMIEDDDEKLFHLKRLVDEITFTNEYDQGKVDELYLRIEKAKSLRYDQESMQDSGLIDEYDLVIASLINEVSSYASTHPKFENYPLMPELINDIREADNRVLFHRITFDKYAKEYNALIETNKDILSKIDPDLKFERKPLFELVQ